MSLRHPPTSASVLRISDEKTMQLVELYCGEPCLWNTKLEDYKNREKRAAAALNIAAILDLPNFTSKHVLMKFKNLRNSYSQEIKKVAASIAKGDEEVYRPKVFWFSKMDSFIRPFVQVKGEKTHEVSIYRQDDADERIELSNRDKDPYTSLAENSVSDDEGSNTSGKRRRTTEYPEVPLKEPLKALTAQHIEHKTTNQMLRDIQSYLQVLISKNDDSYDTFGRYVASMLRNLPPQQAMALQPRIVEMITSVGIYHTGAPKEHTTSKRRRSEDIRPHPAKVIKKEISIENEEHIEHSD